MHRLFKKPIVPILLVVLVAGFGGLRWQTRNGSTGEFKTVLARRGDLEATISATGTIEPVEVVDVGAQVAGLIRTFGTDRNGKAIDYGSMVEEGSILARIDDSVYAADLALANAQVEQDKAGELSAAANVEQVKARLVQAEADWKRAQELSRSKLMAVADYDSYKASYEIAKANVSVAEAALAQAKAATVQARATLDKARRNLEFCTIKSPVKGVIIDRRVNIGQTVVASLNAPSLFLIAKDLTKMQIWVAVNEADVGRIVPGSPVTFTCDAFPGRQFSGVVGKVRLNATMTQNVVMYTVEVNTENSDNVLLPYLTANVRFVVAKETNSLLVPNAALRWQPSSLGQVSPEVRSGNQINLAAVDNKSATNGPARTLSASNSRGARLGMLWLREGQFVRPVEVKMGISDGTDTVILSGEVHDGQELVAGEVETAKAGTQNPFLPQFRKR
jgi:HlyD family secretion protein